MAAKRLVPSSSPKESFSRGLDVAGGFLARKGKEPLAFDDRDADLR